MMDTKDGDRKGKTLGLRSGGSLASSLLLHHAPAVLLGPCLRAHLLVT